MTTVCALLPGDIVDLPVAGSGTFVGQTHHPIWPNLQLVIWRLADGSWSLDALDPRQDVGEVRPADTSARGRALRAALLGGQHG